MEEELLKMIRDFFSDTQIGIKLFENRYNFKPEIVEAKKRGFALKGSNSQFEYYFHGIGFYIKEENWEIDFDYGYNLRTDGFDEWRLKSYWETRKRKYTKISDEAALKKAFTILINNKKITKKYPQDNLYYLV